MLAPRSMKNHLYLGLHWQFRNGYPTSYGEKRCYVIFRYGHIMIYLAGAFHHLENDCRQHVG